MKEIRQAYVLQKKKRLSNHLSMIGVATALLGALAVAREQLHQTRTKEDV